MGRRQSSIGGWGKRCSDGKIWWPSWTGWRVCNRRLPTQPAEVSPVGVGFRVAHHHGHRDVVPARGVQAVQSVLPGPL